MTIQVFTLTSDAELEATSPYAFTLTSDALLVTGLGFFLFGDGELINGFTLTSDAEIIPPPVYTFTLTSDAYILLLENGGEAVSIQPPVAFRDIKCDRSNPCADPQNPFQNFDSDPIEVDVMEFCSRKSWCEDAPFQNFSTEDYDVDHTFCVGPGGGLIRIPPGTNWDTVNCLVVWGPIVGSGTDPLLCLQQIQVGRLVCCSGQPCPPPPTCLTPPCPPPPPCLNPPCSNPICENPPCPPTINVFWNNPATATVHCPDGSPFVFVLPAGIFGAPSQVLADRYAQSYANNYAYLNRLCLSELKPYCSDNPGTLLSITASGFFVQPNMVGWSLISGALPTGMSLPPVGYSGVTLPITGKPTVPGIFDFAIRITLLNGTYMQKNYEVEVLVEGQKNNNLIRILIPPIGAGIGTNLEGTLPNGIYWTQNIMGQDIISGIPTTEQTCAFKLTY